MMMMMMMSAEEVAVVRWEEEGQGRSVFHLLYWRIILLVSEVEKCEMNGERNEKGLEWSGVTCHWR